MYDAKQVAALRHEINQSCVRYLSKALSNTKKLIQSEISKSEDVKRYMYACIDEEINSIVNGYVRTARDPYEPYIYIDNIYISTGKITQLPCWEEPMKSLEAQFRIILDECDEILDLLYSRPSEEEENIIMEYITNSRIDVECAQ